MMKYLALFVSMVVASQLLIDDLAAPILEMPEVETHVMDEIKELYRKHKAGEATHSPDAFKTMEQVCNENGFPIELHQIRTEDDYILDVYRIHGNGPPVILQHGLGADMTQWIFNIPQNAPAFWLASAGYDVWMTNSRGVRFSENHFTLDPKIDFQYWNFTWEEMGTKDGPSTIDLILNKTGYKNLTWIGHSMGAT